jgi:DNA-binding transcriptional MerR regulator
VSKKALPEIPDKRYFTIGEVSTLCDVKPHVLRYWEQEFSSLRPAKRRGNRRYYRREDVLMVRQIKDLLYAQGFTISGARAQLSQGKVKAAEQENHSQLNQQVIAQLEEVLEILS